MLEGISNNTSPLLVFQYLFQRNLLGCFTLFRVHKVGIDLCRGDVLMGEHLRYCINIRAERNLYHSVGMAEAVEGNMLCDTCLLDPFLQRIVYHTSL